METYQGKVQTPQDAIILFEACRLGLTPRVQRRLSEKERQQIKSGSVFVWDEREAGMRRWTDGKSWSASRVSGSFLTYREMEGRRGGNGLSAGATPPAPRKSSSGTRSSANSNNGGSEDDEEGPDGYKYKADGLMKQSFSITTSDGRHLHLISYFARNPAHPLKQPSTDPQLRNIVPQKGMYPEATVNEATNIPAVTRGPTGGTSPHPPAHPPPQMYVAAYPFPPPPGYQAGPMHPHYPPQGWPPSPGHLGPGGVPPGAFYYPAPPPGYVYPHSPYAPPPYPYGHPPPHAQDRGPPPPPQSSLPPLNGQTYPSAGQWAPPAARTSSATYAQSRPPTSLQESYSRSAAEQRQEELSRAPGPQLAPVVAFQNKPPTPPESRNGAKPPANSYPTDPRPSRDANTTTGPTKTFPSIKALINGDVIASRREEDRTRTRSRSRSPVGSRIRDVPSAMAAGGRERDRSDLKSPGFESSDGNEQDAHNRAGGLGCQNRPILRSMDVIANDIPSHLLSIMPEKMKSQLQIADNQFYRRALECILRHCQSEQGSLVNNLPAQPANTVTSLQSGSNACQGNKTSARNVTNAFDSTNPMGGPNQPILLELPAGLIAGFSASFPDDKKLQLQTMTDENSTELMKEARDFERDKQNPTVDAMPGNQAVHQPQIAGQHRQTSITLHDAQTVIRTRNELLKALEDSAPTSTLLQILNEMKTGVVPSAKLLQETKIGVVVDGIRFMRDRPDVAQLSTEIVNRWRTAIESHPGPRPSNDMLFGRAWSKSNEGIYDQP
ncbi:cAMP-independent regulatory protein pac2 [Venturia nashicola]|nr:cAMP-independent regulatory protein pac2 [Venturia nashicola]